MKNMWMLGYLDEAGEDQLIGFAHSAEGATALAESYLLDRDLDLALPWKKVDDGRWQMRPDDDTTLVLMF